MRTTVVDFELHNSFNSFLRKNVTVHFRKYSDISGDNCVKEVGSDTKANPQEENVDRVKPSLPLPACTQHDLRTKKFNLAYNGQAR